MHTPLCCDTNLNQHAFNKYEEIEHALLPKSKNTYLLKTKYSNLCRKHSIAYFLENINNFLLNSKSQCSFVTKREFLGEQGDCDFPLTRLRCPISDFGDIPSSSIYRCTTLRHRFICHRQRSGSVPSQGEESNVFIVINLQVSFFQPPRLCDNEMY